MNSRYLTKANRELNASRAELASTKSKSQAREKGEKDSPISSVEDVKTGKSRHEVHSRKVTIKKQGRLRNAVTHEYQVEYGYEDDSQEEGDGRDKKKVKVSYKLQRKKDGNVESQIESVIDSRNSQDIVSQTDQKSEANGSVK